MKSEDFLKKLEKLIETKIAIDYANKLHDHKWYLELVNNDLKPLREEIIELLDKNKGKH